MSRVVVDSPGAQESCPSPVIPDECFHTQAHLARSGGQGATQKSRQPKVAALPWEGACSLQTDESRSVN